MPNKTDARKQQTSGAANNPRQDRLKSALRENLKRRKAQARGRQEIQVIAETEDPVAATDRAERSAD